MSDASIRAACDMTMAIFFSSLSYCSIWLFLQFPFHSPLMKMGLAPFSNKMPKTEFLSGTQEGLTPRWLWIPFIHSFSLPSPIAQAFCIPLVVHWDCWVRFCRLGAVHQLFLHDSLGGPDAGRCSERGKPSLSGVTKEPGEVPPFWLLIWSSLTWWSGQVIHSSTFVIPTLQ